MKIKRLRNFIAEKSSVIYGVAYNSTWKDSELIVFLKTAQPIVMRMFRLRYIQNYEWRTYSKIKVLVRLSLRKLKTNLSYTKIEESVK